MNMFVGSMFNFHQHKYHNLYVTVWTFEFKHGHLLVNYFIRGEVEELVPLTGFSRRTVRSTTDTLGVGTRKAMPVSLLSGGDNDRSGKISDIFARAALSHCAAAATPGVMAFLAPTR